jgi:hypothetical protein
MIILPANCPGVILNVLSFSVGRLLTMAVKEAIYFEAH